ncbi:hypothetical protein QQF64_012711 [Cirrhinus molitorella]|uniref:Uncharacterized protein n=1 Tax=Cirrhinus molitorella TaxID=172907 RepID=A0ABR3LW99_9TELE
MGLRLHNASYKHPFGLRCHRLQDGPIAMPPGNCSRWQFVIRRAALHSILFRRAVRPPQRDSCGFTLSLEPANCRLRSSCLDSPISLCLLQPL